MKPRVVLGHPSGNQFFRHLASRLNAEGRLAQLCTTIDWRSQSWIAGALPRSLTRELRRRSFSEPLGVSVRVHPWRELFRLLAGRLGWSSLVQHETGRFSVDAVYRDFDRWVAHFLPRIGGANAVYAYEDAAEETFTTAAKLGLGRIYDLPIVHWKTNQDLLSAEASRWPEWESTLLGTRESSFKLARKHRELASANVIVCPSIFVADSLKAHVSETQQVVVAPFGSPPVSSSPVAPGRDRNRPLRVLFAGSMSQRKGLADLFEAMKRLNRKDVELVVLGSPVARMDFYRNQGVDFIHEAPRPHGEVLQLMRTCDVLCLPSIAEGRALVIQEAMSAGLPVIITPNTGADDLITDGDNGFVVPIRQPSAIAERIAWFAKHREAVPEMGHRAQTAAARLTWSGYAQKISDSIQQALN